MLSAPAAIRLRPHHLLCLLTFAGEGYSREFVANFAAIVERIRAGERVELVRGPDDVCAPLTRDGVADVHCGNASVSERDAAATASLTGIAELAELFAPGGSLVLGSELVAVLRRRFAGGSVRTACAGCEWSPLCTQLADAGFTTTAL